MGFIDDEIEKLRLRCIGCGKCSNYCPSLKHGGCDPMEIMMGNDDDVLECISCGNCSKICRRSDPFRVMQDLICLRREMHLPQHFHETGLVVPMVDHPSCEELNTGWDEDGDVCIMPGCIAKAKYPFLEHAAAMAVKAVGGRCSELKGFKCCTHPIPFRELLGTERRAYKQDTGRAAGDRKIVTLCGGCSEELIEGDVDAVHIIPYLHERIDSLPRFENGPRVAIQPGCSAWEFRKEMTAVIEAMGCKPMGNKMGCCGKNVRVSEPLMEEREAECAGADYVIVACPMCFQKYDSYPDGIPVLHIAELVAMAAGDDSTLKYHRN